MKKIFLFALLVSTVLLLSAQKTLTPELLWKLGRVSDAQVSPDGQQVLYGITYYDLKENKGNRDLHILNINTRLSTQITNTAGGEYNAVWRPDGKKIAFLAASDNGLQIFEINPDGTEKVQISFINGGINGFSYSPDMKHILYIKDVKLDKTPNEIYPDLPKADARIIDELMYRHWDSWHDYKFSHVFFASYTNGKLGKGTDLMPGQRFDSPVNPWGGMEQIVWNHDGSKIAYTCKKLNGKFYTESTDTDIFVYDLNTNITRNISNDNNGFDRDPLFSPDGKWLIWQSMKTPGFESDKERLMLYNMQTGRVKDLSEGFDQNCGHFSWNSNSNKIYLISGIEATYQIYEYSLDNSAFRKITSGDHNYTSVSESANGLIGTKMSMSLPTEIFFIRPDNGEEAQITQTNTQLLNSIELAKVEKRWIKTTDGKKMLTWVILPPGFDKKKEYPAILYCQGGPQSAVSQFFSYRWNFQMMAANGYVVVAPNRRGLPTFGQEWNDQISQDYGGQNMKDYLSAIDEMVKEPWIDGKRLGAVGASYGGFSVYWLAGNHNKRFKAFISHCGMFNFESWYGTTEEMWFANHDIGGPYWAENIPKSYAFSPHKFVGKWDTPILVIHGANDFRVPFSEGMQAFNAAQLQDIPSRFLYFPEETHFVLKPQNGVLWQREFFRWLDNWLKDGTE